MTAPRRVSKTEKILFPIIVTIIVALTFCLTPPFWSAA